MGQQQCDTFKSNALLTEKVTNCVTKSNVLCYFCITNMVNLSLRYCEYRII